MAISNLVLTQQIYSEEPNGAHAHYREPVPLSHDCTQCNFAEGELYAQEEMRTIQL